MYFEPKRCVSVSFRNEGTTLLITYGKSAAVMNDSTAEKVQLGRQISDQIGRRSINLQTSHIGAYVQSLPESPTRHISVLRDIPGSQSILVHFSAACNASDRIGITLKKYHHMAECQLISLL
jgi:hypothetical protein